MLSYYSAIQFCVTDLLDLPAEPRISIHFNIRKIGEKLSQHKLISALLARSQSDVWREARLEWEYVTLYKGRGQDSCLCGHTPIIELCEIRNKLNDNTAIVGNCCVKRFLNIQTDLIFHAVKRIERDHTRSVNLRTLNQAISEAWITEWEYDFYKKIQKKQFRKLSPKRAAKKIEVNHKILRRIHNRRR